ncbi:MAG: hypothetical protein JXQ68_05200 [Campylobacterales bacterium]|nr:hypothetical protein [Campylobacterales bacterium]
MENKIKESVATLLAHIIKIDHRDIEKEAPLFCSLLGADFGCSHEEAKAFLTKIMNKEYDVDYHIALINKALCDDNLSKMQILERLNHIIYSDEITPQDYDEFERIKEKLLVCKK